MIGCLNFSSTNFLWFNKCEYCINIYNMHFTIQIGRVTRVAYTSTKRLANSVVDVFLVLSFASETISNATDLSKN